METQSNENVTQGQETNKDQVELKKLQLFEQVITQIPGYLKYFDDKRSKHQTPITKLTITSFIITILVIIILTGVLVYVKILDSSSFTFIVGTLIGYLFGISKVILEKKDE
jgi:F0F1-type ATP synthase assembly protein I